MPIPGELAPLTCIVGIPYAQRPRALDPAYGADGVELCLDVLGPAPLPEEPLPTILRVECPAWGPGPRAAGIGPSSQPMLAQAGFLTVTISVRHSGQAVFPAQLHDAWAAVRWLRSNPLHLPVDQKRIGIWGQSAGGHLAALVALTGKHGQTPLAEDGVNARDPVQAAVTMSGPSDFLAGDWPLWQDAVVTDLFGGDVSIRREEMYQASPIAHVTGSVPPIMIVHGTKDETIPFSQGERLHHALQAAGADSRLVPLPGAYHNLRADPRPAGEMPIPHAVGDAVIDFFNRRLRQC